MYLPCMGSDLDDEGFETPTLSGSRPTGPPPLWSQVRHCQSGYSRPYSFFKWHFFMELML